MALLFFDGFDHMATGNPGTLGKWGVSSGTLSCQATVTRTGTHALQMNSSLTSLTTKPLPASGGAVVGIAWQSTTAFNAADLIRVVEGTTVHIAVGVTAGGLLTVKLGATVLQTGATVLSLNTWYYIELLTVIHDSAGSYELRINGGTELSATAVDTRNGGTTGQWDRIRVASGAATLNYFDDGYVCDTSGSAPRNTFLGAVKVETLYPQTDAVAAGSNAGLTPSTGTDHGALVDEAAPNTTDYNSSATVGVKDTYQYPAMSLTGLILGVQTNLYVQKSDAAARQVCAVVRSGGADYDGANVSPLTTFSYFSEVRALNPATGAAWTTAEVALLEAGMKVTL